MENLTRSETTALMKELVVCFKRIYEIGRKLGFDNILEKAKAKEVIMGYELGDTVFSKSTGEVKGADAINDETGDIREYKTIEIADEKSLYRFYDAALDGKLKKTFAGSMTYNNAYSKENVESYEEFSHMHGVFYRGDLIAITDVSPEYVTGEDGLMKRITKSENGAVYKSTNGNSVSVHYENGGVRNGEGKIIYVNDIRE
jgi:hypothetical protein|tara:strand:- start:173 stop:775 length:603 start_codon:yes stop_codon:yes gene_type:complete